MRCRALIVACLAFGGCAHLPLHLPEWSADKAVRLAACGMQGLESREEAVRCLGRFAQSSGTEACKAADQWLANLPVMRETKGESDAN